ncbi:hypothetical protein [Gordonia sihwensis]|uniref:hypothetical protein n=1 Tax=Gordonia sihwensis TaxID=173559 RepID=UPI002416534D|nr:hypothetical protein [Gordonia sihwensis]WFN91462.1 hypothetical protein P5P27_11785 [Gordonia sihwensis]WFN91520.1 hypothetical protein P5P27_12075 [Gordonia sihwensis]
MDAASDKQIDYIKSLQDEFAYLADYDSAPDQRAVVRGWGMERAVAELKDAKRDIPSLVAAGVEVSSEMRKQIKANLKARAAEIEAELAEQRAKAYDAKLSALSAPVEGLSKDAAAELIEILKFM